MMREIPIKRRRINNVVADYVDAGGICAGYMNPENAIDVSREVDIMPDFTRVAEPVESQSEIDKGLAELFGMTDEREVETQRSVEVAKAAEDNMRKTLDDRRVKSEGKPVESVKPESEKTDEVEQPSDDLEQFMRDNAPSAVDDLYYGSVDDMYEDNGAEFGE